MDDLSAPRILAGTVGTRFRHVEVHASLPSTQTLLVAEGGPDGRVIVTDHQTAGRGRAGRSWLDVPGAMLMFSALVRGVPPEASGLVSLQAGTAVARALGDVAGVDARLKWPNDVRIDGRKVCGILGELSGDHVVIGIGINVGHVSGELPDDLDATSLRIQTGAPLRRDEVCAAVLRHLHGVLDDAGWLDDYRARCETIGARVRVELHDSSFEGAAEGVADDGALVVDGRAVVAGDVVHVR